MPSTEVILFPATGNSVIEDFVFVNCMEFKQEFFRSLLVSLFFTWWSLSAECQTCSPLFHWSQKGELLLPGALHLSCFSLLWHTQSEKSSTPRALGWGISWQAKYLASTRLNKACCYCFRFCDSWDRNVGSLPRQFYTLAVSRWCFLSGHCVMQPYSPQLYCMVNETSRFESVPPLRYVHEANLTIPM